MTDAASSAPGHARLDVADTVLERAKTEQVGLVRFVYADHGGIIGGKATHGSGLEARMASGIGHTVAMMAMSMLDHLQPVEGMGPVGEVRIVPDPRTFVLLPYAPGAAAMVADLVQPDGQPWEACARTFLKQAIADLAAKPVADQAGNGTHLHGSLFELGPDGAPGPRNVFANLSDQYGLSETGYHFIGGVLAHLPALIALTCGSANSYRRLAPQMWSSAYTVYGMDNREAAVRICSPMRTDPAGTVNLALKPSDSSANPYLSLGASILAGLARIRRLLDPGVPVT